MYGVMDVLMHSINISVHFFCNYFQKNLVISKIFRIFAEN